MCNTNLADSNTVRAYCQKSCGLCGTTGSALTCSGLSVTCNTGQCALSSYFSIASIKCTCPSGSAGAYCQRGLFFIGFYNPSILIKI